MQTLSLRAAIVGAVGLSITPVTGVGQTGPADRAWTTSVIAGAGVYQGIGTLGVFEPPAGSAVFRMATAVAVSLHVRTPVRWVSLRADVSRTLALRSAHQQFSGTASCGPSCVELKHSRSSIPVGANVFLGAVSAELDVLRSTTIRPFAAAGVGVKRIAFDEGSAGSTLGLQGLEGTSSTLALRGSVGLEVPLGDGAIRLETADYFSGFVGDQEPHGSIPQQATGSERHDLVFTLGFRYAVR